MAGTKIEGLKLTKVVGGDTVKEEINGNPESLRLCCLMLHCWLLVMGS